jgi:DNA-binding MarR family transcriptional regulator
VLGQSDAEVAARLRVAVGRLIRYLRHHAVEQLTVSQLSALATLGNGPLRLGELAAAENISPSTLTRIVASLEERGLVARRQDADDRRVIWTELTATGTDLLERMRQERTLYLARRVATLDAPDRAALETALPVLEALASETEP